MTVLTCSTCGFDASLWSADDLEQTLIRADRLIGFVVDGAPDAVRDAALASPVLTDDLVGAHGLMHRAYELAELRRVSDPFEAMIGNVSSLQASGGGVPKTPVQRAEIGPGGVVGDGQNDRLHHGRPWQAVCLYSAELLDGLRTEGHPIAAGYAGENITISGIDWNRMRGGLTIEIGAVRLRTSTTATPCHKIGDAFLDRNWNRIHHGEHPGWARWYASVLAAGAIEPGDTVRVCA